MKVKRYLLLLVAACGSRGASEDPPAPLGESATPVEPEKLGVVFERLLVESDPPPPLFGPDGSVTVGARRWTPAGSESGRHAFARSGQLRPVAIAGTSEAPRVIALGWSGLDDVPAAPAASDRAWLVTAGIDAQTAANTTPIHHEFLGENNIALSPDGASLATIERSEVVVRAATTGTELARHPLGAVDETISFPEAQHVCWLDDEHVAWIGIDQRASVLRVAAVRGAIATTPLGQATKIVACDPAGGAAALEIPGSHAVLDLSDATIEATHPRDSGGQYEVAVAARGHRVAIADANGFTLYRREGATLVSAFALERRARTDDETGLDVPKLAFARDGRRLAVTDATLLVVGDISSLPAAPKLPSFAFDLPRGFIADQPIDAAWQYAQLPMPSGVATLPSLIIQARSDDDPIAHVIALAVDRAELPNIPPDNATDTEMKAFAKRTMQSWFEAWQLADLDDSPGSDFTITVGHTNGMRWFETRELHRDGCEPYDGYTRVVLDAQVAYIIRAITVPGGKIEGWLAPFLDLPFGARVKTALRKGPRTGPC